MIGLIIAAATLSILGYQTAAFIVGTGGTVVVLVLMFIIVGLFDPMNAWPNASFSQRITNVLTFRS